MLSINFNDISAVNAENAPIERIYAGSDIVWTEDEQMRFIVELSGGQLCAFDLSAVERDYDELDPFMVTWPHGIFSEFIYQTFGVRRISAFTPIVKIRDNQSTSEYGIRNFASAEELSDLEEIVLPKATNVWPEAFNGCKSLKRACLTNVSAVSDKAFFGCISLSSISLPKLKTLGEYAFWDCSSLVSVDLGLLCCVPADAFRNMDGVVSRSNLQTALIPNALCVEYRAFADANKLQTVYSPSLRHIGHSGFQNCYSLSSILLNNVSAVEDYGMYNTRIRHAIMPNCVSIGKSSFLDSKDLIYLHAPSVETIDGQAFMYCSKLSNVNIIGAKSIGNNAFADTDIRSLEFNRLQNVDSYGLSCDSLTSITVLNDLSDGVPTIYGNNTADHQRSVSNRCIIYVNDASIYEQMCQAENLSATAYRIILLSCKDQKTALTAHIPQDTRMIYQQLTTDKTSKMLAATYDGGSTLEKPFSWLFDQDTGYEYRVDASSYIDIRDNGSQISALDDGCFQNFYNLSSLHLPYCTSIGEYSLGGCSSLVDLSLCALQHAGSNAFSRVGVSSLSLPNLTSVDSIVFSNMQRLEHLSCQQLKSIDDAMMYNCNRLQTLELPMLSSFGALIGDNLASVKRLVLPALSSIASPIAMPGKQPSALTAINIASIPYADFTENRLSTYFAVGFAEGCSLTCSDGVFTL